MADWQDPFSHGDHFAGTEFQEHFRSKPMGMNRAPDPLVSSANQPPKQRDTFRSGAYRKNNRRRVAG